MDKLLKDLVASGVFGPGRFSYMKINNNSEIQTYRDIAFYDVGIEQGPAPKTLQLAVKSQHRPECIRNIMNVDKLYSNEHAMYKVILPFLNAEEIAPQFYYGRSTLGSEFKKDILILQDVRSVGFTKSKRLYLDYHELCVAMKNLGKFHGLSYRTKNLHAHMFSCMTSMLQALIPGDEEWDGALRSALERGIRPLLERAEDRSLLQQVLNRMQDPRKTIRNLRTPKEPFGVIQHGEFCKENILFHYNEKGNATDCKFIDFQMSHYCDPSFDITYILYANTKPEDRDKYWDDLLDVYWKGMMSIEPNPGFTYEQFLENLSKKAISGYIPSSIFLTRALSNDPKRDSTEQLSKLSPEERAQRVANIGGTEGTNALTKIVKHLLDRGYLEKYVQSEY